MCERQILCKIETTKQVGSGLILSLAQQKKNTFQIKRRSILLWKHILEKEVKNA